MPAAAPELELVTPPPAQAPAAASPAEAPKKRGRPPLDAAQREAKAKREAARRLAKQLEQAKDPEDLWRKVEQLRSGAAAPANAPAAKQEVFTASQKTPAELAAEAAAAAEQRQLKALQEIGALLGTFGPMVQGTRFELDEKRGTVAMMMLAPYWADQPNRELSPKMKLALALTGVAVLAGPGIAQTVKEYGPKVGAWLKDWNAGRKAKQAKVVST